MSSLKFLFAIVAVSAISLSARASVPELEQFDFVVCKAPGVVFYFSNLSAVENADLGHFDRSRRGHFVFQASNPELPKEVLASSHGVGSLSPTMTKRIRFHFQGEGAFSHFPDVAFTLTPTDMTAGFGTLVVEGTTYNQIPCRIGLE